MSRLPGEVQQVFNDEHFVAKLTNGKSNSVWIDNVLEVTENKALKSSGGIIGLKHQDNALGRWFLARPVTAKFSMTFIRDINCKPQKDSSKLRHRSDTVAFKVSKVAKIRNRYNQVPHLAQDTNGESDKLTVRHHRREPRGQPFPSR